MTIIKKICYNKIRGEIMQENQNTQYANRIKEIDERIEGLKSHMSMWGRAGAGKMAMKALDEIESLISSDEFTTSFKTVSLPMPDGPEKINKLPLPILLLCFTLPFAYFIIV